MPLLEPDETGKFGPIQNPVDRFMHLPEYTRTALEQMRPEDWQTFKESMEWVRFLKNVGKFWKWVFLTILGTFITAIIAGEKVILFLSWFKGGSGK